MVDSKINAKKYFLPVYAFFMFFTPSITFFISGYIMATGGDSIGDHLPWSRLPAFFALFGLVWPLTVVVSPGFFQSVTRKTDYTFLQALGGSGPMATKAIVANILLGFAWIGPVIATTVALILHKRDVAKQTDEPEKFGWLDYLAAFI